MQVKKAELTFQLTKYQNGLCSQRWKRTKLKSRCVCVCVWSSPWHRREEDWGPWGKAVSSRVYLNLIFLTREPIPCTFALLLTLHRNVLSGKSFPSSLPGKSCPISSDIAQVKPLPWSLPWNHVPYHQGMWPAPQLWDGGGLLVLGCRRMWGTLGMGASWLKELGVFTQNLYFVCITTTPGDSYYRGSLGNSDPVLSPQFIEETTESSM